MLSSVIISTLLLSTTTTASSVISGANSNCASESGPRVRKSYNSLTQDEKDLYAKALEKSMTLGLYNKFVELHMLEASYDESHQTCGFFGYHRKFILGFENMLRSLGDEFACLTLPIWDLMEEKKNQDAGTCSSIEECSAIATDMCGGASASPSEDDTTSAAWVINTDNGEYYDVAATYGGFDYECGWANPTWDPSYAPVELQSICNDRTNNNVDGDYEPLTSSGVAYAGYPCNSLCASDDSDSSTCLPATLRSSLNETALPSYASYDNLFSLFESTSFSDFTSNMLQRFHNSVHSSIGGDDGYMRQRASPRDPMFWSWHATVDYLLVTFHQCKLGDNPFAEYTTEFGHGSCTELPGVVEKNGDEMPMPLHPELEPFFVGLGTTYADVADHLSLPEEVQYVYNVAAEIQSEFQTNVLDNADICPAVLPEQETTEEPVTEETTEEVTADVVDTDTTEEEDDTSSSSSSLRGSSGYDSSSEEEVTDVAADDVAAEESTDDYEASIECDDEEASSEDESSSCSEEETTTNTTTDVADNTHEMCA